MQVLCFRSKCSTRLLQCCAEFRQSRERPAGIQCLYIEISSPGGWSLCHWWQTERVGQMDGRRSLRRRGRYSKSPISFDRYLIISGLYPPWRPFSTFTLLGEELEPCEGNKFIMLIFTTMTAFRFIFLHVPYRRDPWRALLTFFPYPLPMISCDSMIAIRTE